MQRGNLFAGLPKALPAEVLEPLHERPGVRIERILSRGHTSPAEGWYDQDADEWVALLAGEAELTFESGAEVTLVKGDWILIPAHVRHRVARTSSAETCVWLAVHIGRPGDSSRAKE